MGKGAYDAKRSDLFWLDPDDVVIEEEENNPLFDERAAVAVNEALVNDIMNERQGVLQPVIVRKIGNQPYVVDGRQRVKACREANRRLVESRVEPLLIPAINWRGDDKAAIGAMISANEHRLEDSVLTKAQKLARYLNTGASTTDAAVHFGVSRATISNWLRLLELDEKVKKLVSAGKLSATAAAELHDLPRDEQVSKADELAELSATVEMVRESKRSSKPSEKKKRIRTKAEIEKKYIELMEGEEEEVSDRETATLITLEWVLNNRDDLGL